MEDKHKPACWTCVYAAKGYRLECRVKPPSPNYKTFGRMFPIVDENDWCARYKFGDKTGTNQIVGGYLDEWDEGND